MGYRFNYWYPLADNESNERAVQNHVIIPIEIVGFFRARDDVTTEHWIYPPPYSNRLFAHPDAFKKLQSELGLRAERYDMQWIFDHRDVNVGRLSEIIQGMESIVARGSELAPETRYWHSPLEFFHSFHEASLKISLFLLVLSIPAIGMVLYYIVLMAGISVSHRKKEIVTMQSRGAGRLQVTVSFFLEWLILGIAAYLIGPHLGLLLAKIMGMSAGFLSFVNRRALPVILNRDSLRIAIAACGLAVISGMLPVLPTFRYSVVTFRQRHDRRRRSSLWHRLFLDFVLLGFAFFGYRELMWQSTGIAPDETLAADPILFFVPVVFLLGASLLVLRIYPFLMSALRRVTARFPGVVWQITFRRLTQGTRDYVPLLVLLMLTLSLGIYTASTARTLKTNLEDRIYYAVGADLATEEAWQPLDDSGAPVDGGEYMSEPPFLSRLDLESVVAAARVIRGRVSIESSSGYSVRSSGDLMAIEPSEFARTAWFRRDLAPAHFYDYLRLLARHKEGILVSSGFMKENELELGDALTVYYKDQPVEVYVAGEVPYWPAMDPISRPFIVAHIDHVQEHTALEPYNVWYKLRDRDHIQDLVEGLAKQGVFVTELRDAGGEIIEQNKEPYRMGFFGMLSMGFLVSALITVLGFLFFTFFSMRGRVVQFGALRAMGLSTFQLVSMLGLEQVCTIGAGLGAGALLGALASEIFLPFLRDRAGEFQRLPPFIIVMQSTDTIRVLAVFLFIFLIAVVGLSITFVRMKLAGAIRLGEDV